MQCFIKLEILLMLEFQKQFIMPYLCHIFIMHALYRDRTYAQSIVFSYFKRKHQDWFIFKNLITLLILSFSNQKWCNSLIKLKLKIVFSSANMSTTNYLPSLRAGLYFPPLLLVTKLYLQPKVIWRFVLILQQLMVKELLLV